MSDGGLIEIKTASGILLAVFISTWWLVGTWEAIPGKAATGTGDIKLFQIIQQCVNMRVCMQYVHVAQAYRRQNLDPKPDPES